MHYYKKTNYFMNITKTNQKTTASVFYNGGGLHSVHSKAGLFHSKAIAKYKYFALDEPSSGKERNGKERNGGTQLNFFLFTDKFLNLLMRDGKKTKAVKLFFDMLVFLKKRVEKDTNKKASLGSSASSPRRFQSQASKSHQESLVKHFIHDVSILNFLSQAVDNVTPCLEVRKVRVSGTTYLVPAILSKKRQQTTAIRWLIDSARKKQNNSNFCFSECLVDEIFDAYKKQGHVRQKRDELHRIAEANRAYIRYRWW